MTTVLIIALALVIPILLIPAALIWYINIGGIVAAITEARKKQAVERKVTIEA